MRVRFLNDKADIDNAVFRLHYRFTSAFFFASSVIITAFDLIGSPIDCITDDSISRPEVINTYCWIQHTFTLPGGAAARQPVVGGDMYTSQAFPNVGPEIFGPGGQESSERRIHSYYQWVPFVLFLQGILFYMPHWIWKQYEDGKIRNLTDGGRGFSLGNCLINERKSRCAAMSEYLQETMHTNGQLALAYVGCELLNLVNVIGNIFFIDRFLNGTFLSYGSRVIQFSDMDQEDRFDPMIEVFPRMTKCTFHKYGSSGTIQKHDALCVLAWNIFNEKIYIFLWFWLIILSILSTLALAYRLVIAMSTKARVLVIQRLSSPLRTSTETVIQRVPFGDYFILNLLGKNLQGFLFNGLVDELAQRFTIGSESSKTNSSGALETAPILSPQYPGAER